MGNPTKIGNATLTWINGRQLSKYEDPDKNLVVTYKYNESSIRTEKTVNGVTMKYGVEGNKIIYCQRDTSVLYFMYNGNELLGFEYKSSNPNATWCHKFYYVKNLQGDIIGIKNASGETVVTYQYDDFGKPTTTKKEYEYESEVRTDADLADFNPFKYRGYYYDEDTELYYLTSRYYNPIWGRFINADSILGANYDIINYNLYVYCSNNFIILQDSNGNWSWLGKFISKIAKTIAKAVKALISRPELWKPVEPEPEPLPDYTSELNKVLKKNAQKMNFVRILTPAFTLGYFYIKEDHGRDWDYKLRENWERDISIPYLGVDGQFIYNGIVTTAEDFGNIHYGYIGSAGGIVPTILYMGGGYAKCGLSSEVFKYPYYCDDENDHFAIQRGINMYYHGY